jgi:undecaprenyl phosphate-alpha-L-ara4N flippase subunit ArnE
MSWTARQLMELLCFPVAIAAGQILFKRAASQITPGASGSWLIELARLPTMWVAVALYAGATLLWVRILTTVPLSRAYPFVALAFVLVPAAGYVFFHEPITIRYALGTALIVIGVAVSAGAAS